MARRSQPRVVLPNGLGMAQLGPSKNTRPERSLRMMMVRGGMTFSCQSRWGPAGRWTVDFLILGCLVDVHGLHWHGRPSKMSRMSKFWRDKLEANRARDRKKVKWAKENGLTYLVLWDYEVVGKERLSGQMIIDLIRFERRRRPPPFAS